MRQTTYNGSGMTGIPTIEGAITFPKAGSA